MTTMTRWQALARRTLAAAAAALALGGTGCSDQNFSNVNNGSSGDGPRIEVTPTYIDFGLGGVDDPAVIESFTIKSVGGSDLAVSGIELSGSGAASYTLLADELDFVLPPGSQEEIEVSFQAVGADDEIATAIISSDDPDAPLSLVDLVAEGEVPELQIQPDPLDMGTHGIGCETDNTLSLTNIGTDSLTVTEITHSGGDFTLIDANALPLTMEPGDWTTVDIVFTPVSTDTVEGTLSVTSTEPMGTRTALQYAAGTTGGDRLDSWEIPDAVATDILFSLDQSCSMTWDIIELYSNFDVFVDELQKFTEDWQVIVANADDGCHANKIIRPGGDFSQDFQDAMFSWGNGDYTEALLTINHNAVELTDKGECNNGFMRPDAMLHIIDITDEPEQSPESWNSLVDQIVAEKGSLALTKISAIAGDVPNGCSDASPATGYAEAVDYTGGEFVSICQSWATTTNLGLLAAASVSQDRFQLSSTPIEETIEVKVNGTKRTTWEFHETSNSVVFTEKAPEGGDLIDISYETNDGDCD